MNSKHVTVCLGGPGGRLARVLAAVLVATGFLKAADGFPDAVAAVLTAIAVLAGR